jgi:beta-phosphoglucomutase-like phosphatase (HAD superfamily)
MHVSQKARQIFTDFNGVLDDIEMVRLRLWVKAMKEYHRNIDPARLLALSTITENDFAVSVGRVTDDWLPKLEAYFIAYLDGKFHPQIQEVKKYRDNLLKEEVGADYSRWPKKAGFDEFIDLVREPGRPKTFIVSSQSRERSEHILFALGVPRDTFEIISCEDVCSPKPNPEAYRIAIARANTRCGVALEDSEAGLQAASAVPELKVVQVDPRFGVSKLAHYSVKDLTEFTKRYRNGDFQ